MRPTTALLLAACTGSTARLERAEPLQVEARLPMARHAAETDLHVYVWPTAAPPDALGPDDPACRWWQGERDARDRAHAGLRDGSLRWGALTVTPRAIGFAGRDLVPLEAGRPAEGAVVDGALPALSAALVEARAIQDAWYDTCGSVYRDRPLLVVDADVPGATLALVLRTAAALRFPRVAAMVQDPKPERRAPMDPDDPGHLAVVRQRGEQVDVFSPLADRRLTGPLRDLEPLIASALSGRRYGCTLVVASGATRWEEIAATIDWSQAFRTHTNFLHFEDATVASAPPPDRPGGQRVGLNPDNRAAVLWIDLPNLSWRDVEETRCDATATGALGAELPLPETLDLALTAPAAAPTARAGLPRSTRARPLGARAAIRAYGPVDAGTPDAPAAPLAPLLAGALACADAAAERADAPDEVAFALQIRPDGAPFGATSSSFSPSDPIHACLSDVLATPPAWPADPDGRFSAIYVGIGVR